VATREEIYERIAGMDDAALPDLLEQLNRFERRRQGLSSKFFDTLGNVQQRNRDLSEDEAMGLATEAVRWARRTREP